jgi:hypothetical protein
LLLPSDHHCFFHAWIKKGNLVANFKSDDDLPVVLPHRLKDSYPAYLFSEGGELIPIDSSFCAMLNESKLCLLILNSNFLGVELDMIQLVSYAYSLDLDGTRL